MNEWMRQAVVNSNYRTGYQNIDQLVSQSINNHQSPFD
jgi:hypothetical protein